MVSSLNLAVLVAASTLAVGIAKPLQLSSGIFYSPGRHSQVTKTVIAEDLSLLAQHFSSIRTNSAKFNDISAIAMAASANLRIGVIVSMGVPWFIDSEIQAVCDGVAQYPQTVEAVYVGSESLKNGDIGMYTADQIIGYINEVKKCVKGKVPVGSILRANEWLHVDTADAVAKASDLVGCNIYPFFTPGTEPPIKKLESQWGEMLKKFGHKVRLTKTDWPHMGEKFDDNVPSKNTMQQYFDDYRTTWSSYGKNQSYYFRAFDATEISGARYEIFTGLFDTNGVPNIQLPITP
ncbi:unnamed protein product [Peronospora effusa]|uniref:glucan endo-1,3-beta-D-glucosidase n=1 Tax=Peronospora effusa TaxID=542832 RepID=A0A3M6VV29_9STRA|nr:hypothetical protein DD238_005286 [Peronospora effusa]CAI5705160.1 unnamed protein product [Peronospora effusa]